MYMHFTLVQFLLLNKMQSHKQVIYMYMYITTVHTCIHVYVLTFKHDNCGGKNVPPPTVPTSNEGMVQLIYKSSLRDPALSSIVIQLELPTT